MFEHRIEMAELIDSPACDAETIRKSHAFMRWVNRFFGGTAAVKQFVRYASAKHPPGKLLEILDIGSGSCDIPRRVLRWPAIRDINVQFTCLEKHATALELAKTAMTDLQPEITCVNADIFEYRPDHGFDYAVASMFLHHLTPEQIVALIRHLRSFVRKGFFVNDLHRSFLTYTSGLLVSPFISKEVRNDALISIRKGFKLRELKSLLAMPDSVVIVKTCSWGRVTALLEWKGNH